jgi:hypothetical protein
VKHLQVAVQTSRGRVWRPGFMDVNIRYAHRFHVNAMTAWEEMKVAFTLRKEASAPAFMSLPDRRAEPACVDSATSLRSARNDGLFSSLRAV